MTSMFDAYFKVVIFKGTLNLTKEPYHNTTLSNIIVLKGLYIIEKHTL